MEFVETWYSWSPTSVVAFVVYLSLTFNIFNFFSETAEQRQNLKGSKFSTSSTKLCFWCRSLIEDGCPSLWLAQTFFTSLSQSPMNFDETWQDFCPRWLPWSLIGWNIYVFFSETAEWILTKLHRKQASPRRPLPRLYFYPDPLSKMATLASDWLKYFLTFFPLNGIWQVCVVCVDLPSKMAALASDSL